VAFFVSGSRVALALQAIGVGASHLSHFQGFEEFEDRILGTTHTEFAIDVALCNRIRSRFMQHVDPDGVAEFRNPNRADLLRKS